MPGVTDYWNATFMQRAGIKQPGRWLLIGIFIVTHVFMCVDSARRWTPTHDEYWHLPVGLLNLQDLRFDHDVLNPPLGRMWAAFPLWLQGIKTESGNPTGEHGHDPARHGDKFIELHAQDFQSCFFQGRCMVILFSVASLVILIIRAREWFGENAMVLATILWCTNPNIIAHTSLVTTDMGTVFCFLLVFHLVIRMAEQKNWQSALWLGIVLGASQLMKFTSILLLPLSVLTWCIFLAYQKSKATTTTVAPVPLQANSSQELPMSIEATGEMCDIRNRGCLCWRKQWAIVIVSILFIWNAGYLFQGTGTSLREIGLQSNLMQKIAALPVIGQLPIPLPIDYLRGFDLQQRIMQSSHPVFLYEWYDRPVSYFYLTCLLLKNPALLSVLVLASLLWFMRFKKTFNPTQNAVLFTASIWFMTLLVVASLSKMQLGIRYILPIYPFMILCILPIIRWYESMQLNKQQLLTIGLSVWAVLGVIDHPHHLSFMNKIVGGTWSAYNILGDSNYDWGQDLYPVKAYCDAQKIDEIKLAYFGTFPAEVLGIKYILPPAVVPEPGWYAVSANMLNGRPYSLRKSGGEREYSMIDRLFYLRFFEPTARLAPSMFIFHLTPEDVKTWKKEYRAAQGLPPE
jgi:hypothetical protein